MGSGFSKMKKQAQMLQSQLSGMQEQLKNSSFEGTAGSGLITVIVNGEKELKKIKIRPECVTPDDVEGLEDLILAAYKDAAVKADAEKPAMPGMPFGF